MKHAMNAIKSNISLPMINPWDFFIEKSWLIFAFFLSEWFIIKMQCWLVTKDWLKWKGDKSFKKYLLSLDSLSFLGRTIKNVLVTNDHVREREDGSNWACRKRGQASLNWSLFFFTKWGVMFCWCKNPATTLKPKEVWMRSKKINQSESLCF